MQELSEKYDFLYFSGLIYTQFFCQDQENLMLHHTQSQHVKIRLVMVRLF